MSLPATGHLASRRGFLKTGITTAGGLLVSCPLPARVSPEPEATFAPNVFVEIGTSGDVTIRAPVPEIGQGVRTALPMLVAEELEVDWSQVGVAQAEADASFGGMVAAGSDSIVDYWEPLRMAGATARVMLIAAAAQRWEVDPEGCHAETGVVHHTASGRSAAYAELVSAAAQLSVPQSVRLKEPRNFKIIGRRVPRVDLPDIVTGRARYGLDFRVPGMLYAAVARCPVHGGVVSSFDAGATTRVPGVLRVVEIAPLVVGDAYYGAVRGGVAVVAESTWAALQGRAALRVVWNRGSHVGESTERIRRRFREARERPSAMVLRDQGDASSACERAERLVEADYQLPLLTHGCMEPMNFTASVREGRCDAWGPTQSPRSLQATLAAALGLPAGSVRVRPTLVGGGFGRRLAVDYGVEAALLSRAVGAPVQVAWSREDDMRHDYYRQPSYHRMRAALDGAGRLVAWHHHLITPSLRRASMGPEADPAALYDVAGAADLPYGIDNVRFEYTPIDIGVQLGSWRSVSHSFNVFAVACFLDEIASAAGVDPLRLQLSLLGEPREVEITLPLPGRRGRPRCDTGRLARVLEAAAHAAGWSEPLPTRTGRGIACCRYKNTYVAHVAEVEVDPEGQISPKRIVAAVDAGIVVNPDGLEAQVEGAALEGVATLFDWGVTLEDGAIQEGNFDTFPLLRMSEAPKVEVHLLPSDAPPSGGGEPPYPSVAPALANAVFAATGTRLRRLPAGRGPYA